MNVNVGRVGVAVHGVPGNGVLCWPHVTMLKAQAGPDAIVLFRIKETTKPCNVCTEIKKMEDGKNG